MLMHASPRMPIVQIFFFIFIHLSPPPFPFFFSLILSHRYSISFFLSLFSLLYFTGIVWSFFFFLLLFLLLFSLALLYPFSHLGMSFLVQTASQPRWDPYFSSVCFQMCVCVCVYVFYGFWRGGYICLLNKDILGYCF
ncbi:hypothetical protein BD560DRAFT_202704 [Blakeslea trispora]|nr:hypothetical protein BD560DRAFT_202704 [Blakeslea trispora]